MKNVRRNIADAVHRYVKKECGVRCVPEQVKIGMMQFELLSDQYWLANDVLCGYVKNEMNFIDKRWAWDIQGIIKGWFLDEEYEYTYEKY